MLISVLYAESITLSYNFILLPKNPTFQTSIKEHSNQFTVRYAGIVTYAGIVLYADIVTYANACTLC